MTRQHEDARDARLEQLAERLGASAAERLDVERVAAGVVDRLRAERLRPVSPARMRLAWLRAAAIVVVVIGAGALMRHGLVDRVTSGADTASAVGAGPALDLDADQLQDLLATWDVPVEVTPGTGDAGLEDLSEPQLQTLLRAMED